MLSFLFSLFVEIQCLFVCFIVILQTWTAAHVFPVKKKKREREERKKRKENLHQIMGGVEPINK